MNTKISLLSSRLTQPIVVLLLLSVLIFLSVGSNVKGQTGGDVPPIPQFETATDAVIQEGSPVPGGPGFIMVSPFEFKPYSPNFEWGYVGKGLYNSGMGFSMMDAGLNLPDGANINKVTLYYKDSSTAEMTLYLFRGSMDTSEYQMAHILSDSNDSTFKYASTTTISDPVVNNQVFSYFLYVYFPGNVNQDILLTNVRIDYDYTVSVPLVMR